MKKIFVFASGNVLFMGHIAFTKPEGTYFIISVSSTTTHKSALQHLITNVDVTDDRSEFNSCDVIVFGEQNDEMEEYCENIGKRFCILTEKLTTGNLLDLAFKKKEAII